MKDPLDAIIEILVRFWTSIQGTIEKPLSNFEDQIKDLNIQPMIDNLLTELHLDYQYQIIAFFLIFGMAFLFSAQVYAWMTGPRPKFLGALALGIGTGILAYMFVNFAVPMIPAVLGACITGVYGWQGYAYVLGMVLLEFVFLVNTLSDWKENRPLELLK